MRPANKTSKVETSFADKSCRYKELLNKAIAINLSGTGTTTTAYGFNTVVYGSCRDTNPHNPVMFE